MKPRVLVTGGAGFIGTHLCRLLTSKAIPVTVLDLKAPTNAVQGVSYLLGDIRNSELLAQAIQGATHVYHLAAKASVEECQRDPIESYSVNFFGTLNVLEAVRTQMQRSSQKIGLVFSSTAAVYGDLGNDQTPLRENRLPQNFLSFYAAQKHAAEQAIALYHSNFGIPARIFRFFNVYGPGQNPSSSYSGVISKFLTLASQSRDLPLNGGGLQSRDFVSVKDIVNVCSSLLTSPLEDWNPKPLNIGTGKSVTIFELAEKVVHFYSSGSSIVNAPRRNGDILHSCADIEAARLTLGYVPQIDLDGGIQALIELGWRISN